jgi:hypothetical protein
LQADRQDAGSSRQSGGSRFSEDSTTGDQNKMTFLTKAIRVSVLGISALGISAMAKEGVAGGPNYNPATVVNVMGTVSAVRQVQGNDALAGVHLTVRAKSGSIFDVVVGPAAFLRLTRTNFSSGEYVEVQGSLVNGNTVLSREVYGDDATLTLRDATGTPVWGQWGL